MIKSHQLQHELCAQMKLYILGAHTAPPLLLRESTLMRLINKLGLQSALGLPS